MSESPRELYGRLILDQAPRALGMIDRQAEGRSAGSCDRSWWCWKFVDFPRPRFQEVLCAMAWLHQAEAEGNRFRGEAELLRWIHLGLEFWTTLPHKDGSFDEAYPFERSLAATAFTSFYVAETLKRLGEHVEDATRAKVLDTLARAGGWLKKHDESHGVLSNHLAAAAAALQHAGDLCGDTSFHERRDHFVGRILDKQSKEGWYEEYGGADPGYQTHGTFYLARIWQQTQDAGLLDSLRRANAFLVPFRQADGSLGGEIASRNTKTWYPAGFEMLREVDASASWLAAVQRPVVATSAAAGLPGIDHYNFCPLLNNLVFAWDASAEAEAEIPAEPTTEEPLLHLEEAGLVRIRRPKYDAYVGVNAGGTLKVFDRDRRVPVLADSGFVGRRGKGLVATQHHGKPPAVAVNADEIALTLPFASIARPVPSPGSFFLFRGFSLTIGRFGAVAAWLKRLLVKVLINKKESLDLHLERVIRFEDDAVSVHDRIVGTPPADLESVHRVAHFSSLHMGSSRYFVDEELVGLTEEEAAPIRRDALIRGAERTRRVEIA